MGACDTTYLMRLYTKFDLSYFLAPHLWLWYLKWQYAQFTTVKQIWQFSIQSNGQDCTRSWECPQWVHVTLGTLNGRLYDLMKQQQHMWCQVSLTHKQARMEAKALLSRIGAHPQKFVCTWLELLLHVQLVHWKPKLKFSTCMVLDENLEAWNVGLKEAT